MQRFDSCNNNQASDYTKIESVLRTAFETMDENGDGVIAKSEGYYGLKVMAMQGMKQL